MKKRSIQVITVTLCLVSLALFYQYGRSAWVPMYQQMTDKKTIDEVIAIYGTPARDRLRPYLESAGLADPPARITLLTIKDTKRLELWAELEPKPKLIRSYPILAASGTAGPKLREGDRQVPEGLYAIEGLNPNSAYHLSMKLDYPNAFDRKHALAEGREQPGTNIFIHGKAVSIGCLAIGDPAIEDLFILATDVGIDKITVAIAPTDPRIRPLSTSVKPAWVADLYQQINLYFARYRH